MKNKHFLILIIIVAVLFNYSCKKEVVKTVSTSKSLQLLRFYNEKQISGKYKVTINWTDLDSALNSSYGLKLYDLNNQQTFNDSTVTARTIALNNVDESHPYALRIISNPKLDSTKLRFKITMGNVDITVFDRW
ncbi:MAG: hypothetical protein U0U67_07360 [Chitinophagales bacterium]